MGIEVTARAMKDIVELTGEVGDTYLSKRDAIENLDSGTSVRQAAENY